MIANDNTDIIAQLRSDNPELSSAVPVSVAVDLPAEPVNNSDNGQIVVPEVATKREIIMADIVTGTVTGQLDITSLLAGQSDIRRENVVESKDVVDAVKTAGWANSDRTGTEADRVVAQDTAYFIAGQSQNFSNATALAALKASTDAQFAQTLAAIQLAAYQTSAAATLAGEKNASAIALGQAMLGKDVVADGASTRALINELKMADLNRQLQERHTTIVEANERSYGMSQFASVNQQLQALHSQFQAATQGTVNFGTMSGNAGRNTSTNNVV